MSRLGQRREQQEQDRHECRSSRSRTDMNASASNGADDDVIDADFKEV